MSEAALGSFEELSLDFAPEEEGTMMIYTANQTAEDLDVYMDDMMVMHTEGPIIRVDDYYPFGLTFNTSERSGFLTNKFLYNGVELQEDLGLGLYQTMFRMYDPAIGRFTQIDPLSDFLPGINPYNFGFDNPISFADPTGLWPEWLENLWGRLFTGKTKTQVQQRKTSWNNKPKKYTGSRKTKKKNANTNDDNSKASKRTSTTTSNNSNALPRINFESSELEGFNQIDFTPPSTVRIPPDTKGIIMEDVAQTSDTQGKITRSFFEYVDLSGQSKIKIGLSKINIIARYLNSDNKMFNKIVIYGGNTRMTVGISPGQTSGYQPLIFNNIFEKRARAIRKALMDLGIMPSQIDTSSGTLSPGMDNSEMFLKWSN